MTNQTEYSLKDLARVLDLEFVGDPSVIITGLASLTSAKSGDISFFHDTRFAEALKQTLSSVVILSKKHIDLGPSNSLLSDNPYSTYAKVSQLFEQRHKQEVGISSSAVIDVTAKLGKNVSIGSNVVIEAGVIIGDGAEIQANCVIGQQSQLGKNVHLYPNVTIYNDVKLGDDVCIHSSTVVGADGFGYAPENGKYIKIIQSGGVKIGNNVEIGACSTIDRGALDDTEIDDGVKIDNQVQVAHNVKIGANSIICGCSAIAGSSTIGKNCIIAGGVGIINHIKIVDNVTVSAMSLVNQDINSEGVYSSGTGLSETKLWKKNIVRFKELDEMSKRLKALEKSLKPKS